MNSTDNLVKELKFKQTELGLYYIVTPVGPLFWTMSDSKKEAIDKLLMRLKGDSNELEESRQNAHRSEDGS